MKKKSVQRNIVATQLEDVGSKHEFATSERNHRGQVKKNKEPDYKTRVKKPYTKSRKDRTKRYFLIKLWSVLVVIILIFLGWNYYVLVKKLNLFAAKKEVSLSAEQLIQNAPSNENAQEITRYALQAATEKELSHWVVFPPGKTSEVIEFFQAINQKYNEGGQLRYYNHKVLRSQEQVAVSLRLEATKNDAREEFDLFLIPDAKGVWRLDYESMAGSHSEALESILNHQVIQAQVRARVSEAHHYNVIFEQQDWVSVQLQLSDQEESKGFGYVKRDSDEGKIISALLSQANQSEFKLLLRIRKLPKANAKHWVIESIKSSDWLLRKKEMVPEDVKAQVQTSTEK